MSAQGTALGRREREILRAIVQDYIQTGDPVGSQPLLARHDLEVSSATVRNVMADLEARGLLEKPHASAGRVPTPAGYRLYVDLLVKVRQPSPAERERIEKLTHDAPAVDTLLGGTAELLHSLSQHAGVVSTPRPLSDPTRHLEFVRLRENRILAVFVSHAGIVTNKLVQLDAPLTDQELEAAAAYLNEKLLATSLSDLREVILAEMRADESALRGLLEKVLRLAEQVLPAPGAAAGTVLVDGEESFLDAPEFADVGKARALLRTFAEKDRILRVLDRVLQANEVQIFIGAESDLASLSDVSVVAAPYGHDGRVLGALAVIGPTRMNYARVIPLVDLTAKEISRALSSTPES
ncbi:MAG TPA: heat-inducible transcriptional repressor HrcA [Anaeromyxobacteraceae bacterium]|nr:heat-inducible transcriptional repressor HrcA [Anaeromyxobacteraceae bacterium]